MRFGLVGTGPWAAGVHGPALSAAGEVDLVGVWGRSADRAGDLAGRLGVTAYAEVDDLIDDVEAVAFAVPPDVQVRLARRAAAAGRHLLLDKPVATDVDEARALAATAQEHDVASVVFLTDRFTEVGSSWLAEVAATGGWRGGSCHLLADLDAPGNPYGDSAWRRERGALWDVGPHVLSTLTAALGPVIDLTAVAGAGDLVHLVLRHESGATSTASLSLFAPASAVTSRVWLWGDRGTSTMPDRDPGGAVAALQRAALALVDSARTGRPHEADLRLGVHLVELLARAEQQR